MLLTRFWTVLENSCYDKQNTTAFVVACTIQLLFLLICIFSCPCQMPGTFAHLIGLLSYDWCYSHISGDTFLASYGPSFTGASDLHFEREL